MDDRIRFTCPACQKRLKAAPEHAGKRVRCTCGQSVRVPSPAPLPSEAPPRPWPAPPEDRTATRGSDSDLEQAPQSAHSRRRAWLATGAGLLLGLVGLGAWVLLTRDRGPLDGQTQTDIAGGSNPTYDEVTQNPGKHVGKRVTWPVNPWEGADTSILCTLMKDSLRDPNLHGLYLLEFGSNAEVVQAFDTLIDVSNPLKPQNVSGTFTGMVERPITITHRGEAVAAPKVMKLPKLSNPVFMLAETIADEK